MNLLKTERLYLRNFEQNDLVLFASLMADPEVMRFSLSGPLSHERAKEIFQNRILGHYQKYGYGLLAIFLKESHEFIGGIGLMTHTIDGIEEIELAYRLFPKYWNQGFATEAATAVCEYAFRTMNIKRLISIIDPKNHKSLKVAKRVGMHFWKDTLYHDLPVHVYVRINQSPPDPSK
jgi:RimJ/RimL family protein N-acetyltransferase